MKTYTPALVLLCTFSLQLSSCIWQPPERNSIMAGRKLEKENKYLQAQAYYENMRSVAARDVSLHNLNHLYGDIIAAMQAQQDAPNSPEAYYELGRAYYDKMLSIPDVAAEISPNMNFETAAYFAEQRKQFQQQAQPALEAATQLQPQQSDVIILKADVPNALTLKARVYEAGNTPELAIPIYQEVIAAKEADAESYYRLAALLFNQGNIEQALGYAREAVNLFPDDANAHFVLGKLYAIEDMRTQAIEAFQECVCAAPYYADAYYRLAQVYLTDGNTIDAERVLRLGVLNNPEANRITLAFRSLEAIVNQKQMNEFMAMYDSAISDITSIFTSSAATAQDAAPHPMVENRYFRLLIQYLERQRPYTPPCSEEDSHPYYDRQIRVLQEKIRKNEHLLAEYEEAEATEDHEETPSEE